ncbi:MAG: glycosyltransferase [Chitinophagaceae bacterium]
MISIVICSVNTGNLSEVNKSISTTIGIEYELLIWDNQRENKGLCEVYNMMAEKARFDYVCFLHEDIIFETNNWGIRLVDIFSKQPTTGVIGVAGSKYKSIAFSGWYTGIKEFDCANITHRFSYGDELIYLRPVDNNEQEEVVCLDGVFICARKKIWDTIRFDQEKLPGFHFYDIDFSTRAAAICAIVVTYEIGLIHITKGGDFGDNWVKVAISYHLAMKKQLPFTRVAVNTQEIEQIIIRSWLDLLKNYRISIINKWGWISRQKLLLRPSLFYSILKFLLYKPLGLRHIHKPGSKK